MPATDTLHVRVRDVRYPVDEGVVKSVFGPIAPVKSVHMVPSGHGEAVAVVRFNDSSSAEACRSQRDGRCIYSDCNRMEIAFTSWESFVPSAPGGGEAPMVMGPYGARGGRGREGRGGRGRGRYDDDQYGQAQGVQSTPQYQPMQAPQQQQYQQQQQQQQQYQQQAPPPQQQQQQYQQPQQQQYQQPPQGYPAGVAPGSPMPPGAQLVPMQVQPGQPPVMVMVMPGQQFPGAVGGMGGRGRGGIHVPMSMSAYGAAGPSLMAAGAIGGAGGRGGRGGAAQVGVTTRPQPFVNLSGVGEDLSLGLLFEFLEVYGNVLMIRRNRKNSQLVTVKFENHGAAKNAGMVTKRMNFFGSSITARTFESTQETVVEPPAEGNPFDTSVTAFNFTNANHRHPSQRGRFGVSENVKVVGMPEGTTAEALHNFFAEGGFPPVSVSANEDKSFSVVFPSIEEGVKVVATTRGKICGCLESAAIFEKSDLKQRMREERAAEKAAADAAGAGQNGDQPSGDQPAAAGAEQTEETAAPQED